MDMPQGSPELDFLTFALTGALDDDLIEHAGQSSRLTNSHTNSYLSAIDRVHPRMIRHRIDERQRLGRVQMALQNAPVKCLAQTVGGNESETPDPSRPA